MEWFVQLHKKICEWEWYTDIPTCKLFFHILLKCNYKEAKWRGIEVKPGDFITSFDHLAKETWLSIRQVRTALEHLETTWEVAKQSTSQYTILTLTNWGTYNIRDDKPSTNGWQTDDKPSTTTNKYNKEKKEKKEYSIENNTKILSEHIQTLDNRTTRYKFYESMLENIKYIEYELDKKWIDSIENKLLDFKKNIWEDRSKLELENFWLHHSTNKTVMKSVVLRLNTWLNNLLK